ncbi:cilia- and flagella-associated protein 251 isoform X2 [Mastacembelus armatus]|uniref:cilia- and flagella-associated protein 251 isoform X2 n=1 Tax=Mastacembelus armatus TaxID=205130 RepID=UPI000E45D6E7|nr:cilia- and flagella-associated protein 251-like isoform X2 [Mastacembelus armatus]
MEQSLSDLLSDAFSDLDFENLDFDERLEEDKSSMDHENLPTNKDGALHQEATAEAILLTDMEKEEICMFENVDEECSDDNNEDFQGVENSLLSMYKTPEEDYTSSDRESEEEGSVSGEDKEDEEENMGTEGEPGESLMSGHCGDEHSDENKEDRIFSEEQPLAPEGAECPQVRNEEQGKSDEEVSYFQRVPERGHEIVIKGDGTEEDGQEREALKQEDSSDSEHEGMKIEQEENVHTHCFEQEVESPYRVGPENTSLEFPEISVQNLIAAVDNEDYEEKMGDFTGEEHQEAGESFADYPSDFSSCEYVEDGGENQERKKLNTLSCASGSGSDTMQNACLEGAVTDVTCMGREEDTDEDDSEYLYSRDLEKDAGCLFIGPDLKTGEKTRGEITTVERVFADPNLAECDNRYEMVESDSYSSSDDEVPLRGRDEELVDNTRLRDFINYKKLEDSELYSESGAAENQTNFSINWDFDFKSDIPLSEDLFPTQDTDKTETPSGVSQYPAEDINIYSVVQREDSETTSPSYRGSLDDSFFFNTELEAARVSDLGQFEDDECEEERTWEQEQERIKAFFRFYDDSDKENGREERQIKVQFCTDPLSQVIHYETDSDRDSFSSSTDGEEDLSSTETSEELREPENTLEMKPVCDSPNTQQLETVPQSSLLSNTQVCTRKNKCLGMLMLILKMVLVILMALLMFWLVSDQAEWLSQVSFF